MTTSADEKVRATVYFSASTYEALEQFIERKHGRRCKAVSITVEAAVQEYLERHADEI